MTTAADYLRAARPPVDLAVCAGRVLLLAGLTFGAANLFQWGVHSGALGLSKAALALSWPIAVAVFFVGLFRLRRAGGEASRRVAGWSRLGLGVMAMAALLLAAASLATQDWTLMRMAPAVTLSLYGLAWLAALARTGRPNTALIALVALAGSVSQFLTAGAPEQYVLQAATLFLIAVLPGLWLALGRRL